MRSTGTRTICGLLVLSAGAFLIAQTPARRDPYPGGDHPGARANWFARFRQSRDGISPARHRLEAYRRSLTLPVIHPGRPRAELNPASTPGPAPAAASLGGAWTELGPRPETDLQYGNLAGRMTALAVDLSKDPSGNTVYAGAADGGLWKSTNALAAQPQFTPIGDNLPSLAVGSIALDGSTTPTTIYVGTGEPNLSADSYYGVGILKSTDGGQTWTAASTSNGVNFFGTAVSRLLVDPVNPQILLAAVTASGDYLNADQRVPNYTGLYRSSDGGATWWPSGLTARVSPLLADDIIYNSSNQTYYAALTGAGLYSSHDQGQTWQSMSSPFAATAVTPQNFFRASLAVRGTTLWVLVADANGNATTPADCGGASACAGLLQSRDNGVTWQPLSTPGNLYNSQGYYNQFLAAPAGTSALIVGGIDVWSTDLTTPAPVAWTNLTQSYAGGSVHPDEHALVCLDADRWFIANDGGLWSTADAGAHWANLNATIGAIQFYSVTPDAATAGRLLGGSQDNGTALGLGLGSAQTSWPLVWGGDGGHTAINPANPQQLFTENYNVSLQRSDDGGISFQPIVDTTTIADISEFYVPYELAPSDPGTIYLATTRIWRGPAVPTASGVGWTPISPNLIHPPANLQNDDLTALAAAPSSPNVIYAGAYDGTVSITSNATATGLQPAWSLLAAASGGFGAPISALAVSPVDPNTAYWGLGSVGNTAGLFKTSDGGQTVTNIAGDLPGGPINAILIDQHFPNDIYVATDEGVFAAGDGGVAKEAWGRLGDNLPATAVLSLQLTRASGSPVLIAGTHGRGAWSIPAATPPDFTLELAPATATVEAGQSLVFTLHSTTAGGASTLALTCNDAPACTISPATIPAGGDASVTVVTPTGATSLQEPYPLTIQGTNGFVQRSAVSQLSILDFAFSCGFECPQSAIAELGKTATLQYQLKLMGSYLPSAPPPVPFDAPIVFSCPGAPAGITCSAPSVAALAGFAQGSLQVQVGATAPTGSVPLTLVATGGHVVHTITADLTINAFTLAATPATVTAVVGSPAVFTVSVSSASGYGGSIHLDCTNFDSAVCAFAPANIQAGQSSTVTITGFSGSSTPVPITLIATAGASVSKAEVEIQPSDFDLGIKTPPVGIPGIQALTATLEAESRYGFAGPITLVCSTPLSLTCAFAPATIAPGQSSALTISGLDTLPPSTALALSVIATSGGLQHVYPVAISTAGDFTLRAIPASLAALPGGVGTFSLQVVPLNNLQATAALSCAPGLAFACSILPASVPLGSAAVVTVTGLPSVGPVSVPVVATVTFLGATLTHSTTGQLPLGDFSFAATPAAIAVAAGSTANLQLQFSTQGGIQQPLQLSCSGLPIGASCLSSSPVTIYSGFTTNLAIATTATAAASTRGATPIGLGGGLLLVLLFAFDLRFRRRRLGLAAVAIVALASIACGGGGGGGGGGPINPGGGGVSNPGITSTVTITATDATPGLANPTSHSITVQLTIR